MIRIVSPSDIKRWDAETIAGGIPSVELMRRAAKGLYDAVLRHRATEQTVTIFCGTGNNGGDGYALACLLAKDSIPVRIVMIGNPKRCTLETMHYRQRALELGVSIAEDWVEIPNEILVDALLGIGLDRPVTGRYAEIIAHMNGSGKTIVAADIPSGLDAGRGSVLGMAVLATETVTMQFVKAGMLLDQGRRYCGSISVCALASSDEFPFSKELFWQEPSDVSPVLPPRPFDSHKGKNGHALLCVGSGKYPGAALLSARAALRGGCGLLSVAVPTSVRPMFSHLPEAIVVTTNTVDWDESACAVAIDALHGKQAIGVGCGVGDGDISAFLEQALRSKLPMVIDADGLNCLARHRELYPLLHENVVLTPHPGEMARLLACSIPDVLADPLSAVESFPCVVLLKGATTLVHSGKRTVFCTEGTPGLSKGGSGDVLTGIITALLAQGVPPFDAARAGTYLLGTSAKEAYRLLGERMLLATDVIEALKQELYGTED